MIILKWIAGVLMGLCLVYSLFRGVFLLLALEWRRNVTYQEAVGGYTIAIYWAVLAIFFLLVIALM